MIGLAEAETNRPGIDTGRRAGGETARGRGYILEDVCRLVHMFERPMQEAFNRPYLIHPRYRTALNVRNNDQTSLYECYTATPLTLNENVSPK